MSRPEGPAHPDGFDPCDPEKVFEYADGGSEGLDPGQEQKMREHLVSCPECRELYERELDLNASLGSLGSSELRSCSISQHVAMALPTRTTGVRVLWGLLAGVLLAVAFVSLELNSTEPVTLVMSVLGACWGFVAGSADVLRAIFAAAGPTILLVLALGALVDVFIALVVLFRGRRARQA